MSLHVDSQVGRLRQVIVHQPGLELSRLTPGNVEELLFDDILWASRAREEHHAQVVLELPTPRREGNPSTTQGRGAPRGPATPTECRRRGAPRRCPA